MNVLVGCPVSHREWILPIWFEHVEKAFEVAGLTPRYVFVISSNDVATMDAIDDGYTSHYPGNDEFFEPVIVYTDEPVRKDERIWGAARYEHMTYLRNRLLQAVRGVHPNFFLSLDSDILLAPDALKIALEEIGQWDALGLCTYMTPPVFPPPGSPEWLGRECPSKGMLRGGRLRDRTHWPHEVHTQKVDVIMAAKLMSPDAYAVDYQNHLEGEDIGWCMRCIDNGLQLAWCPMAKAKHIMKPTDLERVDPRVGF